MYRTPKRDKKTSANPTWVGTLVLLGACSAEEGATDSSLIHTVTRGDLEITVREQGELQAAEDTRVVSALEGRSTLIYLIEEGAVVEQGTKVAELDVSEIEERRAQQAINVANIRAELDQARKNFEIMEEELRAAAETAQSRLEIAEMRLEKFLGRPNEPVDAALSERASEAGHDVAAGTNRDMVDRLQGLLDAEMVEDPDAELKYAGLVNRVLELLELPERLDLRMGEMANQVLQSIDRIELAKADLRLAFETVQHSRQLASKDFITRNDLERDEINYRRQVSNVTLAWSELDILVHYTLPETLLGLQQEVRNAALNLRSVVASNEARRVRENANLRNSEAQYELARERLQNWDEQIRNAVMRAPAPGLVVYAHDGNDWDEQIMEGMEVRQRQVLIILPDVSTMVVQFDVHEAQIDKVALGQPVLVRVDAFPEQTFTARVSMVSSLPDSRSRWNNNDRKVYKCTAVLDQDNSEGTLRPGMNATVEIEVGVIEDALSVPMTALQRRGDTHFLWLDTTDGPRATPVEVGGNNLTHVEIVGGIAARDRIHLVQPPGVQLPEGELEAPADSAAIPVEASGSSAAGSGRDRDR